MQLVPFNPARDRSSIAHILVRWTTARHTIAHDKLDQEIVLAATADNAAIGKAICELNDQARQHGAEISVEVVMAVKDGAVAEIAEARAEAQAAETARDDATLGVPAVKHVRDWTDADHDRAADRFVRQMAEPVAPSNAPMRDWSRPDEVDSTGAARAAADEAKAARFGLALPPAFFALGTTLVDVGVENAEAARAEYDAMPWALDALRDLSAEIQAERRQDLVCGLSKLQMAANGRLVGERVVNGTPQKFGLDVEREALARLQSDLRKAIEADGDLGIVTLAASPHRELVEQAARTWNNCTKVLQGIEAKQSERKTVALRTRMSRRPGPDGQERRQVFAVVSESYGEIDVDRIAAAMSQLDGVGGLKARVSYDRSKATIDLVAHTDVKPEDQVVGDLFRVGLRAKTDDTGKGSLQIYSTGYRVGCRNYTVVSCDGAKTIIRHLGDTERLVERLNEALVAAGGAVREFAKQWSQAAKPLLGEALEAAERAEHTLFTDLFARVEQRDRAAGQALMDGVYRSLLRTSELVPVKATEAAVTALRAAHWDPRNESSVRDGRGIVAGLSRASISNGLTLWSQQLPIAAAHEAEILAGRIVAGEEPMLWRAAPKA